MAEQEDGPPASMTPVLQPRTHYGLKVKVGLPTLSVDTIGCPAAKGYPRLELEGRVPLSGRMKQTAIANSGMAASAFPQAVTRGNLGRNKETFQLHDLG